MTSYPFLVVSLWNLLARLGAVVEWTETTWARIRPARYKGHHRCGWRRSTMDAVGSRARRVQRRLDRAWARCDAVYAGVLMAGAAGDTAVRADHIGAGDVVGGTGEHPVIMPAFRPVLVRSAVPASQFGTPSDVDVWAEVA